MQFDLSRIGQSKAMSRAHRWTARGKARVEHPKYGSVIVPHSSNYGALENAAEFWGCDVLDLTKEARVCWVSPEEGPVRRPKEFYKARGKEG